MHSDKQKPGEGQEKPSLGRLAGLAFITGFSGAIMPGPLLVVVIEQTTIQGFSAAMLLVTGHALLELVLLAFLILGLRSVIAKVRVRATIGIIGGAALLYMGADMLRHAWQLSLDLSAEAQIAYPWPKLLFLGMAVCAANPYFTGWWATIGVGQLAHLSPKTPAEYLTFYLGHEASDYSWYAIIGLLILTGREWLTDGIYRALIIGCAILIILLSLWFLGTGIKLITKAQKDT
jgi:threonine/homoserine/homoserine lactone efflux protein